MISIRTFLAIDFNNAVKTRIARLQSDLRHYSSSGRWKHSDNFHLTIKFLDEIEKDRVDEINDAISLICKGKQCFELRIDRLGFFPGSRSGAYTKGTGNYAENSNIRVLWLGISGDTEMLARLYSETESALAGIGFQKEKRPFSPHVTIAQDLFIPGGFDQINRAADLSGFESIHVDRLHLYKSEQIKGKRIYTPISEYRF